MDPMLHPAINDAIETHMDSFCSPECRQRIAANYGPKVAAAVRAVYDAAMDTPVDWNTIGMDDALGAMHGLLEREYPWLSAAARQHLNAAFVMVWK